MPTFSESMLLVLMLPFPSCMQVGQGKPVFTIPGRGPQFTAAFAEAQSRLLGESVSANTCCTKVLCFYIINISFMLMVVAVRMLSNKL